MSRKLATIEIITDIKPIPDADAIEVASVKGWNIVINKNKYKVGDKIIMCEVDSFIPHDLAPFLTPKGQEPREYQGIKGQRLRSVRLRGQLSQGLILDPHQVFNHECVESLEVGTDVSEKLGIVIYEPPIPACLSGQVRGMFPMHTTKTNQERIQNLLEYFELYPEMEFEQTEKLDGSSCTVYRYLDDFGVCSHNLNLKEDNNNSFWKTVNKYHLREILEHLNLNISIQAELIGEGIQKNPYKLKGHDLRVFDIYDIDKRRYMTQAERLETLDKINTCCYGKEEAVLLNREECKMLRHVPILGTLKLKDFNLESLLKYAEGTSQLFDTQREGIVCKSKELINNRTVSFKIISNAFLLKNGG